VSRYEPSPLEQSAIDMLTAAGYTVVRQRSYDALRERVRRAETIADMERERREGNERWAQNCLTEERRLHTRLNEVCAGAAALGVSITDINAALAAADGKAADMTVVSREVTGPHCPGCGKPQPTPTSCDHCTYWWDR
jgi:hypothetical protein